MLKEKEEETTLELHSQIAYLQKRVEELESENAKLSSRLSTCRCDEEGGGVSAGGNKSGGERAGTDVHTGSEMSVNHHLKRHIALKVMYFGQRFYGFASEAQMDPTVEAEIFKALKKTRLLLGDKKEIQYSRCGRTDKGVSAVGQVISLFIRSKLKEIDKEKGNLGRMNTSIQEGEIDYVRVLNRALPDDIRIIGWCPVPTDFSARFSCLSREYKYFFWNDHMNLSVMESAGKKLVGEHDFRNFCKMDAINVHNYVRRIISFEISPCDTRLQGSQLYAIKIRGSAFLWHQVRCMVAVLFLIGQGLESPDVIEALLDTVRTPRKPQYAMASEIPLVFHSCEFEGLSFTCSSGAREALCGHLENQCRKLRLQAGIFHEALMSSSATIDDPSSSNNHRVAKKVSHVPLMSRPTEPSYEERRAKLEQMKRRSG